LPITAPDYGDTQPPNSRYPQVVNNGVIASRLGEYSVRNWG